MSARVIAEVAQGYEGKPEYCHLYVKAAASAGADAIKFQVVYADDVAQPGYQYYDFYKTLEMDLAVWRGIKARAEELGVWLFTDISGERAMAIAEAITPHGIKIHSSNFFNRALIRAAFDIADKVFVSLGGIEADEIEALVGEVRSWGHEHRLALLYGFQAEPTPVENSRLARLPALKGMFPGLEIGYMDHTPGDSEDRLHVSVMALALGADWIEKHLTLSRFLEVEDYVSALEPAEFADYVASLRRLDTALGSADMELGEEERSYRDKSVKKIVAARDISAGGTLGPADILFKRTPRAGAFEGIHDPAQVLGRTLMRPLREGDPITGDCLE